MLENCRSCKTHHFSEENMTGDDEQSLSAPSKATDKWFTLDLDSLVSCWIVLLFSTISCFCFASQPSVLKGPSESWLGGTLSFHLACRKINVDPAASFFLVMADSDEDICARCSAHPLEVSLVLICNHRLCLACARKQIQILDLSGGRKSITDGESVAQASCPICRSVTKVEAGATQQILSIEPSLETCANPEVAGAHSLSVSSLSLSALSPPESQRTNLTIGAMGRQMEGTQELPSENPRLRVLPKPRSPLPSSCLQSPVPELEELQTCGQCQVEAANVRCWQCDEFFCQNCYKKIHQSGRMKEHRSAPLELKAAPRDLRVRSQPFRRVDICMQHEEPFQFFCLDCTQCLCAECAVQRGGCVAHGHDVQNMKRAFNQLSGSIQQLLETAADELQKASPKKELTQQLDDVHSKGKQDLQASFLNLEETLKAKEDIFLKGVEESGRVADQLLLAKARQCETKSVQILRLRESLDAVRNLSDAQGEISGKEIQKINLYIGVKKSLATLLPQSARALEVFGNTLLWYSSYSRQQIERECIQVTFWVFPSYSGQKQAFYLWTFSVFLLAPQESFVCNLSFFALSLACSCPMLKHIEPFLDHCFFTTCFSTSQLPRIWTDLHASTTNICRHTHTLSIRMQLHRFKHFPCRRHVVSPKSPLDLDLQSLQRFLSCWKFWWTHPENEIETRTLKRD